EEEFPLQNQESPEHIQEQHREGNKDDRSVRMKENGFVGRHELQLIEKPEAVGKKNCDGQEQSVANHRYFSFRNFSVSEIERGAGLMPPAAEALLKRAGSSEGGSLWDGL